MAQALVKITADTDLAARTCLRGFLLPVLPFPAVGEIQDSSSSSFHSISVLPPNTLLLGSRRAGLHWAWSYSV